MVVEYSILDSMADFEVEIGVRRGADFRNQCTDQRGVLSDVFTVQIHQLGVFLGL